MRVGRCGDPVELLADEPSPGLEDTGQPFQDVVALGEVDQDHASVDEIEPLLRHGISRDVVTVHVEIVVYQAVEEPSVDVGHDDAAHRADLRGEPACDRSPAASYFQAVPSRCEPPIQQVAPRAGIEERRERGESCRRIADRIHREISGWHEPTLGGGPLVTQVQKIQ
ncbi:MAG TPA: hypothetical protein VH458_05015 [Vicinamibacterales bacterium]